MICRASRRIVWKDRLVTDWEEENGVVRSKRRIWIHSVREAWTMADTVVDIEVAEEVEEAEAVADLLTEVAELVMACKQKPIREVVG